MLARLHNVRFITKLDLRNSFWLIPLAENSRKYTGFSVEGEIYQFRVVPFGLSSSCAALVRAMQVILGKYEEFCLSYIDDILIYSYTLEEHLKHIDIIMNELDRAGLKLNLEKCIFCTREAKFLGYVVNVEGIQIDRERLEEIKRYKRPHNIKTLRGFLGILNYYKKFITGLSDKAAPLYVLLKKGNKWLWGQKEEHAFETRKQSFYQNLLLKHPDFANRFILRTDASDLAISAELIQIDGEIEVPICFI